MTQRKELQNLLALNRKAQHELAAVENPTPANYAHLYQLRMELTEQMHLIMQMMDESAAASLPPHSVADAQSAEAKRGRGGQKQYYIIGDEQRAAFATRVGKIFERCFQVERCFELPDGSKAKVQDFLACLYFLGIKLGLATHEAPVKDFYALVTEGVSPERGIANFYVAYGTIQRETRHCRTYVDESAVYNRSIYLHEIDPSQVRHEMLGCYRADMALLAQVEQVWHEVG